MRVAAIGLAVLVAACDGCTPPAMVHPYRAERMEPPAWYRHLHREMLLCLGALGAEIKQPDYDGARWFLVRPGIMGAYGEVPAGTGDIAGKWSWPDDLLLDARFVSHPVIVKHELGHRILQVGNDAHPIIELCEVR